MIRRKVIFFSIAVILLVSGLLSGNRVFYVLLITQAVLLFCILVVNIWAAVSFTYTQKLSQTSTLRGHPVDLSLAIHNEKSLPFPLMHLRLIVADEHETRDLVFNLEPQSKQTFTESMACPYRGSYTVGMTVIDFLDLFGLLRLPFDMRLLPYYRMQQLLVYPRLVTLTRLNMPALETQQFTRHRNLTNDHDQPFALVRKYQPGDAGKRIHWKVSIRHQQLMTKMYEEATEPSVSIILDLHPGSYPKNLSRQAENIFCESATALVYFLLKQNWRVSITGYGQKTQYLNGSSLKDFHPIYEWLARVRFDSQHDFKKPLEQGLTQDLTSRAHIFLTLRLMTEMADLLNQYRRYRTSIYTLIAGPARENPHEKRMLEYFRQSGHPIWFVHYGDDLARVLQDDS